MTVSGASGLVTVCVDLGVVLCLGAFFSVWLGRDLFWCRKTSQEDQRELKAVIVTAAPRSWFGRLGGVVGRRVSTIARSYAHK